MKTLLSIVAALAVAATVPFAHAATPKAAEDANGTVTSVDQPPPRVNRASAASQGKKAASTKAGKPAQARKKTPRHAPRKARR